MKRFQKRLRNQLYADHLPEQNLNSILRNFQSMKESQKKAPNPKRRTPRRNLGSLPDQPKADTSTQWLERVEGFQHLNGCNININNNFINITTLQNKEQRRNADPEKSVKARVSEVGISPEAFKPSPDLLRRPVKSRGDAAKWGVDLHLHKRLSTSNKGKSAVDKIEKKMQMYRQDAHLGKKLMSILKTSPENEKMMWFGNRALKTSGQVESYNSCEKKAKARGLRKKQVEGLRSREAKNKGRVKKMHKFGSKQGSFANIKKSETKEKPKKGLAKNEFNSLKKETRALGKGTKKNFGTLDLRTYTNKENRRIPISCKNKNNKKTFKKTQNKTLLDLFLQKKGENIEDLLKQKMSKSRREKLELMFRRESAQDATEIEGLARLLEKPKPVLSQFHTSKEKSSLQETHESFLGLKPRTRMAKMVPNYINSIDNNINSIQNIHYRRKTEQLSHSRVNKQSNSPHHQGAKNYSRNELKKIRLDPRLGRKAEAPRPRDTAKRPGNYSGIGRVSKGSKRARKSSQARARKDSENLQKVLLNKLENKERLRLRSITEIENYKNFKSIKNCVNHSSKHKNYNAMFKKKISLPDKQRKKETYRLFKSKWGIKNNFEDSIKDSSKARFDFKGVKSRVLADQHNRRKY